VKLYDDRKGTIVLFNKPMKVSATGKESLCEVENEKLDQLRTIEILIADHSDSGLKPNDNTLRRL
jgi:hypothetical protein